MKSLIWVGAFLAACGSMSGPSPHQTSQSSPALLTVTTPGPMLAKATQTGPATVGQLDTIVVSFTNNSGVDSSDSTVFNAHFVAADLINFSTSQGTCLKEKAPNTPRGALSECALGPILAGSTATLIAQIRPTAAGKRVNTFKLEAPGVGFSEVDVPITNAPAEAATSGGGGGGGSGGGKASLTSGINGR